MKFYRTKLTVALAATIITAGTASVAIVAMKLGGQSLTGLIILLGGAAGCAVAVGCFYKIIRDQVRTLYQAEIDNLRDHIDQIARNHEPEYRSVPAELIELCADFEANESEIGMRKARSMEIVSEIRGRLLEVDRKLSETETELAREHAGRIFESEKNRDMLAIANRRPVMATPQPAAVESIAPTRPDNDDLAHLRSFIRALPPDAPRDLDLEVPVPPTTKLENYAPPHIRDGTLRKIEKALGGAASVGAITRPPHLAAAPG